MDKNIESTDKNVEISDKNVEVLNVEISDKNTEISDKNMETSDKNTKISDKNVETSDKNVEVMNVEISDKNTEISEKKNIAVMGMMAAVAIVLGYLESLIPMFAAVPGMKIGLANLAIISALYIGGLKEAGAISLVRIIVVGFLFGNLVSIFYSLAGAFLSMLVMWLLKKTGKFSMLGVSIAGGVAHNVGQIILAMFIVETYSVAYYLPILMVSGIVAGIIIGLVGGLITKRLNRIYHRSI